MNYSIRNLVIAGGLAIVAIAAVLIYTSNVQHAAKEGQARVKVYVARVDVPAGTPTKDILARGDLIQKEVVQDDQLPGVLISTAGLDDTVLKQDLFTASRSRAQSSSPPVRPPPPWRSAVPRAQSASTSRPPTASSAPSTTATTSMSTRRSAPATPRIVRKVLTNVLVLKAQIGQKDTTAWQRRPHPLRAQRPRRAEVPLARRQRRRHFWLAQRPKENALNSPPTVETLQTVLGDGLPAAVQKLDQGPPQPGGSNSVSDAIRIFISGSCAGLAEVRQALSSHVGHQGGRHGRRRSERR